MALPETLDHNKQTEWTERSAVLVMSGGDGQGWARGQGGLLAVLGDGGGGREALGAEQHLRDQQRGADEGEALQLVLGSHQPLHVQQQRLRALARCDGRRPLDERQQ